MKRNSKKFVLVVCVNGKEAHRIFDEQQLRTQIAAIKSAGPDSGIRYAYREI